MDFAEMIKAKRLQLKESQEIFSKRFGVSHAAVSDYEHGKSEAPYRVLKFILSDKSYREKCNQCNGTGYVSRELPEAKNNIGYMGTTNTDMEDHDW